MKQTLLLTWIKSLRPHQWVKNLLLFAPLVLAHEVNDGKKTRTLLAAFALMCILSSAIYLINDICDKTADKRHPVKRLRPIASGALSVNTAAVTAAVLLFAGLGTAFGLMDRMFAVILAGYVLLTIAYSLKLKHLLAIDVITLSFFYTLRLLAGGAAADVLVSPWLLAFSWFFFLSLAFVKRFVDLQIRGASDTENQADRDYGATDRSLVQTAGLTSGFLSVLVFLLYVAMSEQVKTLYANSLWLWIVAPVLVYWLMRIWLLAGRGKIDSDPIAFALKDGASWVSAGVVGVLMVLGAAG